MMLATGRIQFRRRSPKVCVCAFQVRILTFKVQTLSGSASRLPCLGYETLLNLQ